MKADAIFSEKEEETTVAETRILRACCDVKPRKIFSCVISKITSSDTDYVFAIIIWYNESKHEVEAELVKNNEADKIASLMTLDYWDENKDSREGMIPLLFFTFDPGDSFLDYRNIGCKFVTLLAKITMSFLIKSGYSENEARTFVTDLNFTTCSFADSLPVSFRDSDPHLSEEHS